MRTRASRPSFARSIWLVVTLIGIALIAAACSSDDAAETINTETFIVEAEPTPETFDASDPEQLAGVSVSPSDIDAGDCFNEYVYRDQSEFLQQITTVVGCEGPHDREAYFRTQYPAGEEDPAPSEEVLRRWADSACLEEFEPFIGLEYVLSQLEIGAIVPSFETWTDEGDRNVVCFVFPDEAGQRLRSSVQNSGL